MMRVRVNGRDMELPEAPSLVDFLSQNGFPADGVAVAVNGTVIPRSLHPTTLLRDGDTLEVIHAVGGGSADRPAQERPE